MAINDSCRIPGDGCSDPKWGTRQGLCIKHYRRLRTHGDPMGGGTHVGAAAAFLDVAVAHSSDECLEWPYGKNPAGYGVVHSQPEGTTLAHRIVLMRTTGLTGEGLDAAHAPLICHNRACVNPRHLRWATTKENVGDRAADGTENHGERCGNSKLTDADVLAIRSSTALLREEAERYGVGIGTIWQIRNRWTWRHLP